MDRNDFNAVDNNQANGTRIAGAPAEETQEAEAQADEMQATDAPADEMQAAEAQADEMQAAEAQADEMQEAEAQADTVQPVIDQADDTRLKAIIEGVLFTMGKSVSKDDLAIALKTTPARAIELAEELKKEYEASDRGLAIIRLDNSFQMCTKDFCFEPLVRVAAHPKKPVLTEVVLETLSIIAYRQPVTKLEISKIRGVSSDHAVNKLIEYGLVSEQGRLNAPGRPILFGTTEEFLRQFKMESLEDLPIPAPERIAEIQNEVAQEYPDTEESDGKKDAGKAEQVSV